MADYVDRFADDQTQELYSAIRNVYGQAAREIREKLEAFAEASERRNARKMRLVESGRMSEEEHQRWLKGQEFQSDQWRQKLKDVTQTFVNADETARALVGGVNRDVFCEAANYTAYDINRNAGMGVSFDLYDQRTVERLLRDNPQMLPEWNIDELKDYTWNEKRVRNVITQGIIQGESVPQIARRLYGELAASNAKKMQLFARTAVTGSQNAGRVSRMQEARDMGINVRKKWIATLDSRTRDTHASLDGDTADVDEEFSNGLKFPGEPGGNPAEVYNCRCTLGYVYPEYHASGDRGAYHEYVDEDGEYHRDYVTVADMTYKEWKAGKTPQSEKYAESQADKMQGVAFDEAKSVAEAEEYARQFIGYGGSVSYRGIRLEYANACNRVLTQIFSAYEPPKMNSIQQMNMRSKLFKDTTSEAAYRWGMGDLFINPKYYKNEDTFAQHQAEIDSLMKTVLGNAQLLIDAGKVTGTKRDYVQALIETGRQCVAQSYDFVQGTFIHECGHMLDDRMFHKEMMTAVNGSNITYGELLSESRKKYGGGISGYAISDNHEYIAESFTAWWFGEGSKCDPRIVGVFERMLKR